MGVYMELTPRPVWGYIQRRPIGSAPVKREGLGLHYGAGPEWVGLDAPRGLQSVHFGRGFAAVGYPFICDLRGQLSHGRPLDLRGAHTYGHNTTWHAVCVPANSRTRPTAELVESLAWLLRYGYEQNWWELVMRPHKELSPTACPGPLDRIIGTVVRRAKRNPWKLGPNTPDAPLEPPEEDEMLVKFSESGRVKVLYTGSGRIRHLSPSASSAVDELAAQLGPDQVANVGEVPGLSQAGFEG